MAFSWDTPSGGGSSGAGFSWSGSGGGSIVRKKPTSGGGGILGEVGGFFGNLVHDVSTTARQSPGAALLLAGALKHDVLHPTPIWNVQKSHFGRDVVAPIGHQYAQTYGPLAHGHFGEFGHQLYQHPLGPILDALSVVSLGASGAARVAGASRALKAGDLSEAVKAAARRPVPAPRYLTYEGKRIELEASRNPAMAKAQRLLDRAQERFPEPGIPGRIAFAAVGRVRNLPEKVGFALGEERRVREAVERAPAGAVQRAGRHLTTPQQEAIRTVGEGIPIDDRIAMHRAELAAGRGDPAGTRRTIRILQAAKKYVDDSSGEPEFRRDIPQYEKLRAAYEESDRVAGLREELPGVRDLPEASLRARPHGPGRVIRGARFVRQSAQSELRGHVREYPGKIVTVRRPRTREEARADLASLEARYEELVRNVEQHLTGGQPADMADVRLRNRENAARFRAGGAPRRKNRGGYSMKRRPTVKQELRDQAEREIYNAIEKRPGDPTVAKVASLIDERDRLRELLSDPEYHFGDAPAPDLGIIEKQVQERGRRVRVKGRPARKRVAELRGAEDFTGGQFRIPYERRGAKHSLGRHGGVGSGGSIGKPKTPGSLSHSYEGAILLGGKYRHAVTQLVAESYIEAQRFAALLRARDHFLQMAHDERRSEFDIPIKTDEFTGRTMPEPIREYMERYTEGGHIAAHEADSLGLAYEALRKEIFPESVTPEMRGIKWVDRRLLGGLDKPNPLSSVRAYPGGRAALATLDAINNASRFAILYLKPAYAIPNLLGNAALNLVQQGFAAPGNLRRAALLSRKLSREGRSSLDSVMGEGFAAALHTEAGTGRRVLNYAANAWGAVVDVGFRRSAFLHEARKAGYKTDAQLEDLLTSQAKRDELVKIGQRANREIIDYGRLSPLEREVVRRIIFFYPWVKGSTVWGARFLRDHPVEANVLYRAGALSQEQGDRFFGPRPSFANALIPFGQRSPGVAEALSPASASILQTPGDLLEAARGAVAGNVDPSAQFATQFTPALGGLLPALTGRDPFSGYTYPPSRSAASIYAEQVYGQLPQLTLYHRLHGDQSSKLYPYSRRDALMQFLLGSIAPRPVNLAELHARAARERLSREQDIPLGDIRLYEKRGSSKPSGGGSFSWSGG